MNTYIEYVILENIIVNIFIIYQISITIKNKLKISKMIISVLIISIYTTFSYYSNFSLFENTLIKFLITILGIYIAFKPNKLSIFLKQLIYYYLISFMFVGIIISLTLLFKISLKNIFIKISIYIISALILYLFNKFMWKLWKSNIKSNSLIYEIKIKNFDLVIKAFVDTGNSVYDYINNLDVIFLDNKYFNMLYCNNVLKDTTDIKISTVSNENFMKGYIVNDITICQKDNEICKLKKVLIIFTERKLCNQEDFNAIIGYNTYIDKLKGVSLC